MATVIPQILFKVTIKMEIYNPFFVWFNHDNEFWCPGHNLTPSVLYIIIIIC